MLKSVKLGKEGSLNEDKNNMLYTSDNRANYLFGEYKGLTNTNADIVSNNTELIGLDRVDYQIAKPLETKEPEPEPEVETQIDLSKFSRTKDKPDGFVDENYAEYYNDNSNNAKADPTKTLSFMNVKSVDEGIEWYREHNPKIPEDLLPIMARWNWGDLSTVTKKQVKNERKKKKKKEGQRLQIRRDKTFVVEFN